MYVQLTGLVALKNGIKNKLSNLGHFEYPIHRYVASPPLLTPIIIYAHNYMLCVLPIITALLVVYIANT